MCLKPKKTNEERKKELDEFGKMLEAGIKEYIESDRYKELLDNMANFHDYSVNNSIGIMLQKPDASLPQCQVMNSKKTSTIQRKTSFMVSAYFVFDSFSCDTFNLGCKKAGDLFGSPA